MGFVNAKKTLLPMVMPDSTLGKQQAAEAAAAKVETQDGEKNKQE